MRRPLIVGNWKMNKTASEAAAFIRDFRERVPASPHADVVIAPPFTALETAHSALGHSSWISLGAQNIHWETHGAFTGEVSAPMLRELGCRYVIVGHSERRTLFGERDETIHKKVQAALKHGLSPIDGLWGWHQDVAAGNIRRRNGTIYLLNNRQAPIMTWHFREALPLKWSGPDLHASSAAVAFESIELAHRGITRSQAATADTAVATATAELAAALNFTGGFFST